jgi:L-fucose isomerase-like protein
MYQAQSDIARRWYLETMTINIVPFFSIVSPEDLQEEVLKEIEQEGVRITTSMKDIPPGESVYLFIGTGGTENDAATFLERAKLEPPIIILSYDERNSLPASMELRAFLEKRGIEATIVHKPMEQLHALLGRWSKYSEISKQLKGSKLGVIGEPSSWLIASGVNPELVKEKWGLEISSIPIKDLTGNLPQKTGPEFLKHVSDFQSCADSQSVSDEEIAKAGIVAERIASISEENNLDAVTVQCFTLLMDTKISGCYSLSFLNDKEDFVAGCEGDIPATFTMMLSKLLTGTPSFMANVASVDQDLNTAVFAHCTIPTSITERYEITNHFETGMSVGVRGKLPLTEVTIVKVFGEDLGDYWVSGGTIIDNLVNDKGCRTQIRVAMDEPVDYFLEGSLANHHIVVLGELQNEFEGFFEYINHNNR